MRANLLTACFLSLTVSGCIWGDRDFSLSAVRLVEFPDQPPPLRLQLKVEFSTTADLSRIIADGYALHTDGHFCDRPNEFVILMGVRLFFRDQLLTEEVEVPPTMGNRITYSTYMGVARDASTPSSPVHAAYDLRQNPEDVCFYVVGGAAPVPLGYKSNVIRIPKEKIEAALKASPRGSN